ncbi:venom serine carboxypeptidase-like isoform X1 [Rhipicephalus microplus]|uniref:venom serine carboxypeptidase-like isoform X1 n=1 Tax=Rhipicephalus microplus TaxID=6941 RepID=UPI003F6A9944
MKNALSWTLILMLGGVKCEQSSSVPLPENNEYPLMLTPLITSGRFEEARNASEVPMLKLLANVTAYSGFITVNSTCNSSLFFLFIRSKKNDTGDPLMLWTMGGPGLSALFVELLANGPLAFDTKAEKYLSVRNNTLVNLANIIYLDLPVGAGYSFTHRNDCYSTSLENINDHVMEFLRQFLLLFPEYICRDFYLAGESYAARYSVSIANRMLNTSDNKQLILKGVIGGNGFLGSILDLADSSDFMYQLSMVDKKGRNEFHKKFQQMKNDSHNPSLTLKIVQELSQTLFINDMSPTLYQNVTLYHDYLSPLLTERSPSLLGSFLLLYNNSEVRNALHIGPNVTFEYNNTDLLRGLATDYLRNISPMVSNVLNKTNVLLYTGQLDPLFPSVKQRDYLSKLQWKEADAYKTARRVPWTPPIPYNGFAAFLTKTSNFTYGVILGMSHYGAIDKPDEVYFLIKEFVTNYSGAANETF